MRRSLFLVAAVGGLLWAGGALAQPVETGPENYVHLSLGSGVAGRTKLEVSGLGSGHEDEKAGFFGSAAVGHSEGRGALELEALYLDNDIKTGDLDAALGVDFNASVRTYGLLVNGKWNVTPIGPLTASVGAGAGYGQTKYKVLGGSDSKTGFIWQLMAGVAYPVSDTLSWDLQYRFVRSPDFKGDIEGTHFKVENYTHVVAVGARVKF